ncbi:MAG: SCO family protein, partial [Chromatiales bacterium]|nr:SCO family protein [Chromatiales bacterium]
VDQNSRLVTEKDMLGKYQLIQFGYTSCPDICPTSLQVMSIALERLGKEKASLIQPYFVSIDPERDTVELMKEYVRYFDSNLIGLTGSASMIKRVAEQYRVNYEKVFEEGRDPKLYLMDHTASLFLIAPDGTFITKFAYGISADQVVEKLNGYLPQVQ